MSKRLTITTLLFLLLFSSITISVTSAKSENLINGGFWSPPVEAAEMRFTDLERGADGIIHMLGFDACCPAKVQYTQRDLGGTWSSIDNVDDDMDSTRPWEGDLAISSDGTAHAIWTDQEGGSNHKVKYAQRPGGGNWSAPITLSDPAHDANNLTLLINNSDQLYASWSSYGTPGFYTRYQVGGNWGAIQRIDMDQPPLYPIALMDTQQNIHYFWFFGSFADNFRVYYRKQSADNSWGPVTPISDPHTNNSDIPVTLFASLEGQNIYATWSVEQDFQHNLFFTEFSGGSWSSPVQLNGNNDSQYPQFLGVGGGNVYIVSYNSSNQTFTYRNRPSGGSWTAEPLTFQGPIPRILGLVSPDNTFHLIWDSQTESLRYRSRQNLGPWSPTEILGGGFGTGGANTIKRQGNNLDMGWENNRQDSSYSHALILFTDLPPQSYIPAVFK